MQTIADVMTKTPKTLEEDATLVDAAQLMRREDIGDVLVTRDGRCTGIVTDRDIVVRAIAKGKLPGETPLSEVASEDVVTLSPSDAVAQAVAEMRDKAIRRLPVVDEEGRPVGIVSIGDLAVERDADSALADISAAPPSD
ncbi:MAG TPA: CBS domain-containing protein [Actinomycetota bacterium]